MAETVTSGPAESGFDVAPPLWTFLTALSGVRDEFERARLTATGLPSLLPCRLSGAAVLDKAEAHWSLVLQNDGEQLGSTHAEQVLAELGPLFREALRRTTALIARIDSDTSDHRIPPSIATLGIRFLALAPVMTLQQRIGVLLIGREGTDAFSHEEELTLSTLAEHLAIGIENIRAIRQSEERHRVLLDINNAIVANLDKRSLFDAIAKALRQILPFDQARLTLHDPLKDLLRVYALAGVVRPKEFVPVGTEFPRYPACR